MKRPIKFKAYWKNRVPQLGICDVVDIDFRAGRATISNGGVMVFPKLDEIELLQFTGLIDKNGVEIYEGDIVVYSISDTQQSAGEVKWNEKNCYFYFDGKWKGVTDISFYKPVVIGNIYHNPELSKQ